MTTEQMDWLDDERTGRHAPAPLAISTDDFDPPLTMRQAEQMQDFINRGIVAAGWVAPHNILNPDEPAPDLDPEQHFGHEQEEHTHYTRDARDQCAAGDHQYAKLLDDAAEREKIAAHDEAEGRPHLAEAIRELIDRPQGQTTMAEEPIENRLRRAWLNGFKDGVDRASYAATESTGRWDY